MDKVFELKCKEGNINSKDIYFEHTYTIFIVCDNATQAINSVLKPETISIEVVSAHPCLILE